MKAFGWLDAVYAFAGSPLKKQQAMKANFYEFMDWLKFQKANKIATKVIERIKES